MLETGTKKQAMWMASQNNRVIAGIRREINILDVLGNLEGFERSFKYVLDKIICSDERVLAENGGRKIGLAGQLILASKKEIDDFVDRKREQVRYVTSHDFCGAGAIAMKRLGKNQGKLPHGISTGDELAALHSKILADKLCAEYIHITLKHMKSDEHCARLLFVDETGWFNPQEIKELPPHFICSSAGFGLPFDYVFQEVAILCGLAFEHGYGQFFDHENPFYIIVVASSELKLGNLMIMSKKIAEAYEDRIKVLGFVKRV